MRWLRCGNPLGRTSPAIVGGARGVAQSYCGQQSGRGRRGQPTQRILTTLVGFLQLDSPRRRAVGQATPLPSLRAPQQASRARPRDGAETGGHTEAPTHAPPSRGTPRNEKHRSIISRRARVRSGCVCISPQISPAHLRVSAAMPDAAAGGVTLVTNKMCPFAQRAWFCLEESGLAYTLRERHVEYWPRFHHPADVNSKSKI